MRRVWFHAGVQDGVVHLHAFTGDQRALVYRLGRSRGSGAHRHVRPAKHLVVRKDLGAVRDPGRIGLWLCDCGGLRLIRKQGAFPKQGERG